MSQTFDSIVSLRTVALTVMLALTLWTLGIPPMSTVYAAAVTNFSNTLSDTAPSAVADHTITFTTPSGMSAGGTMTVTLADFLDVEAVTASDVELDINGSPATLASSPSGTTWGVTTVAEEIQITSGSETIASNATVTIRVGTNAGGSNQITNPTTAGSYPVLVDINGVDDGETRVAIIEAVTVTASIDTVFSFSVDGVAGNVGVNGATTTGSSTATEIPFGRLQSGIASTTAQDLSVETNAANGFVVTVQVDQQLQASTGAVIDGFIEGSYTTTPTEWVSPNPVPGESNTYGHWGLTTNDATVSGTDIFGVTGSGNRFVSASTTPVAVFAHDGPADGSTPNVGSARVGYRVEISELQEAAEDYTATVTYVATPIF